MKKIFLCLTAIAMFSSCSSDDSGEATASFVSTIAIDGVAFIPATPNNPIASPIATSFEAGVNNGESNLRTFHMLKTGEVGDINGMESIQLSVIYPATQTSVDGTYDFDFNMEEFSDPYIQGLYMRGMGMETFQDGTITVTDLGNNKFKIVFNNVVTAENQTSITGNIEGTFEFQSEDF